MSDVGVSVIDRVGGGLKGGFVPTNSCLRLCCTCMRSFRVLACEAARVGGSRARGRRALRCTGRNGGTESTAVDGVIYIDSA